MWYFVLFLFPRMDLIECCTLNYIQILLHINEIIILPHYVLCLCCVCVLSPNMKSVYFRFTDSCCCERSANSSCDSCSFLVLPWSADNIMRKGVAWRDWTGYETDATQHNYPGFYGLLVQEADTAKDGCYFRCVEYIKMPTTLRSCALPWEGQAGVVCSCRQVAGEMIWTTWRKQVKTWPRPSARVLRGSTEGHQCRWHTSGPWSSSRPSDSGQLQASLHKAMGG